MEQKARKCRGDRLRPRGLALRDGCPTNRSAEQVGTAGAGRVEGPLCAQELTS